MSSPVPWLDRFVKWFFNSSPTTVFEHERQREAEFRQSRGDQSVGIGVMGHAAMNRSAARNLTPFQVRRKII